MSALGRAMLAPTAKMQTILSQCPPALICAGGALECCVLCRHGGIPKGDTMGVSPLGVLFLFPLLFARAKRNGAFPLRAVGDRRARSLHQPSGTKLRDVEDAVPYTRRA